MILRGEGVDKSNDIEWERIKKINNFEKEKG